MKQQDLYRSCHVYELFKPLETHENLMVDCLEGLADTGFYQGVETGFFFASDSIRRVRDCCEKNDWQLTMWATPTLLAEQLNLSSLDGNIRNKSRQRATELIHYAAECGADKIGLPSGDYPGDDLCEQAKKALFEVLCEAGETLSQYPDMQILLEPLDRYAHKRQLIGPIRESMEWFAPLHQECPNIFIHWDSAHEALGGIDLIESLRLAKPFLSQLHLCNAVLDSEHPLYGDWHMDVGQGPEYRTPGYLTPDVGAAIIREVASWPTTVGCQATYAAVEMRSHLGDDMWHKEETSRRFLARCFELAQQ